jgi:hypothetical protein
MPKSQLMQIAWNISKNKTAVASRDCIGLPCLQHSIYVDRDDRPREVSRRPFRRQGLGLLSIGFQI